VICNKCEFGSHSIESGEVLDLVDGKEDREPRAKGLST
jgi:hypothetical protein